jgi:hypothetical protein
MTLSFLFVTDHHFSERCACRRGAPTSHWAPGAIDDALCERREADSHSAANRCHKEDRMEGGRRPRCGHHDRRPRSRERPSPRAKDSPRATVVMHPSRDWSTGFSMQAVQRALTASCTSCPRSCWGWRGWGPHPLEQRNVCQRCACHSAVAPHLLVRSLHERRAVFTLHRSNLHVTYKVKKI